MRLLSASLFAAYDRRPAGPTLAAATSKRACLGPGSAAACRRSMDPVRRSHPGNATGMPMAVPGTSVLCQGTVNGVPITARVLRLNACHSTQPPHMLRGSSGFGPDRRLPFAHMTGPRPAVPTPREAGAGSYALATNMPPRRLCPPRATGSDLLAVAAASVRLPLETHVPTASTRWLAARLPLKMPMRGTDADANPAVPAGMSLAIRMAVRWQFRRTSARPSRVDSPDAAPAVADA